MEIKYKQQQHSNFLMTPLYLLLLLTPSLIPIATEADTSVSKVVKSGDV